MFALAIILYALTATGSPVLAGWLAFAAVAPGLAVSPLAGALIDRVGSIWAITVDMAAGAACVTALIAVDLLGWASAPVLLALTGLFSLTRPLSMAGIRALLPRLVPVAALDRANALDTAIHGLTDIVGPASAGAIVGFAGPVPALGIIAVTFAAAAFCIGASVDRAANSPVWALSWRRRGADCCECCDSPRCADLRWPIRSMRCHGACWSWSCQCSRRDNLPAARARPSPACCGPVLDWSGAIAALIAGHRRTAGRERSR